MLYRSIRPAVDEAGANPEAAIKANAKIQARLLREASPVLADLVRQKQLVVAAAFYDVTNGKVTLLE